MPSFATPVAARGLEPVNGGDDVDFSRTDCIAGVTLRAELQPRLQGHVCKSRPSLFIIQVGCEHYRNRRTGKTVGIPEFNRRAYPDAREALYAGHRLFCELLVLARGPPLGR